MAARKNRTHQPGQVCAKGERIPTGRVPTGRIPTGPVPSATEQRTGKHSTEEGLKHIKRGKSPSGAPESGYRGFKSAISQRGALLSTGKPVTSTSRSTSQQDSIPIARTSKRNFSSMKKSDHLRSGFLPSYPIPMEVEDVEGRSSTSQLHPLPQSSNNTRENLGYMQMEVDDNIDIPMETASTFSIAGNMDIPGTQVLEDKGSKNVSMLCGGEGACAITTNTEGIVDMMSSMAEQALQENGGIDLKKWSAGGYCMSNAGPIRKRLWFNPQSASGN